MSRPSARTARLAKWAAIPVTLLASGALVATSSYSAFSATTTSPTVSWKTGTVALDDNDLGTALFDMPNLKPGATDTKCITVSSAGTLPAKVKLYATPGSVSGDSNLAKTITLKVEQGTGTSTAGTCSFQADPTSPIYSGSLADFSGTKTNYASGVGTWVTTGSADTHVYRFTYSLPDVSDNTLQGKTASLGFTWEAQNL